MDLLNISKRINRIIVLISITLLSLPVHAAGEVITFTSLDELLWSIVMTIQYYTLPIMAIALVFLGIKLVSSGEDTGTKDMVKTWMIKIMIGGVLIFGATVIAELIKKAVGG